MERSSASALAPWTAVNANASAKYWSAVYSLRAPIEGSRPA